MSDIAFYVDRARRAHATVSRLTAELAKDPSDRGLKLDLASAQRLAERADADVAEAAREQQTDLVHYRLVERSKKGFHLNDVSKSLGSFQDLVSNTFSALQTGAKRKATVTVDILEKTTLEFGWTYSGSLGVVLLAPSEHGFFDGRFDETANTIVDLVCSEDFVSLAEAGQKLGPAIINKAYDWASANVSGDFDLDLQWRLSHSRTVGGIIDKQQFSTFIEFAKGVNEESLTTFERRAVLVGINVKTKQFHLVEPDGDSYKGKLSGEFDTSGEYAVNHFYQAHLTELRSTEFATGEEKVQYTLQSLSVATP